ncbi:MAG: hypothetical protein IT289_12085 [Oligoflexia bacterium]|nr:hypothetical protein [Oligoflexia bacterium]
MHLRLLSILVWLCLSTAPAFANTGPFGFSVGFGSGVGAIDFSDGSQRWNVGGIYTTINGGVHINILVFSIEASLLTLQGRIWDYVATLGGSAKIYLTESLSLKAKMAMARYEFMTYSGNITNITSYLGGSFGGQLGWDLIGTENQPFRLSFNAGAERCDFGAVMTRQGMATSNQDISNHVNGLMYYGYFGFDWYL